MRQFPEVDRADWFPIHEARSRIYKGLSEFLERLIAHLQSTKLKKPPRPNIVWDSNAFYTRKLADVLLYAHRQFPAIVVTG